MVVVGEVEALRLLEGLPTRSEAGVCLKRVPHSNRLSQWQQLIRRRCHTSAPAVLTPPRSGPSCQGASRGVVDLGVEPRGLLVVALPLGASDRGPGHQCVAVPGVLVLVPASKSAPAATPRPRRRRREPPHRPVPPATRTHVPGRTPQGSFRPSAARTAPILGSPASSCEPLPPLLRLKRSGLGRVRQCWVRHPARTSARNVGSETRLVVGEGLVDNRVVGPEPTLGSAPEPDEGDYSLVVVRLATSDGGERSSIAACRYAQPTGGRLDRRAC